MTESAPAPAERESVPDTLEKDVEEVIAAHGGDARAAVADLIETCRKIRGSASSGYARGRLIPFTTIERVQR